MKKEWRFINKSVAGTSHARSNTPCQDYTLCLSGEGGAAPVILAVSDGHGGSKYFRSAQGAVFACETAVEIADEYARAVFAQADTNIIKQLVETRLKLDIVKKWRELVFEHIHKSPFTDEELSLLRLSREEYKNALKSPEITERERLYAAYGATLLIAVILEAVIITIQIGDGDILFYYKRGSKTIFPVPKDERNLGNETTSLCSLKAPFYMRHSIDFTFGRGAMPDLIMLATDGYANSFSSEKGYMKAAKDFYDIINTEGAAYVTQNIEGWLNETSSEGSGDDITLAIAWRE